MRLYCVRHGQPEEATADVTDPGLSKKGSQDITAMVSYLSGRISPISRIYTSPKQRTKETAMILHNGLSISDPLQELSQLRPSQAVDAIAELIWTWQEDTILVGHNPSIGELVSQLILGATTHEIVRFTPGTIVCLERQQTGNWVLHWVIRPELLAQIK